MRARELMRKDFRLLEAAWPIDRAVAVLQQLRSELAVIRRLDAGAPLYYVYSRSGLLERLRPLLTSGPIDVRQALNLRETQAVPTARPESALAPFSGPMVVVDDRGPVGVISPTSRTRGFDGPRGLKSAPSANDAGGTPAVLTRHLVAELPETIVSGATASLVVSLAVDAPAGASAAPLARTVGTKIDVVVKAVTGFTLMGSGDGQLVVQDPQPDLPIQFRVKAGAVGTGTLKVYGFCDGVALVGLTLTASIVAEQAPPGAGDLRESVRVDAAPRSSSLPDLSLYIFESNQELSFRLQSADGKFHMKEFGPVQLRNDPGQHFQNFFRDIEGMPLETAEQRKTAQRRLEAKGANLFDLALPNDLKVLLWDLRERITTVQVTSDEPWIPWEVCRLKGRSAGRIVEGKFFAEAFAITRWLYGVGAPRQITMDNLAVVVPEDSQLPKATAEKSYLLSLHKGARQAQEVPATYLAVTEAMARGEFDVWHFSCHGRADLTGDGNQSAIELADREVLKPEDVIGAVENVLAPSPFVFLNACQSARGGVSLTGIGGWAQRFLRPGPTDLPASAFVGTYWAVYDDAAFAFAEALYDGLLRGLPIGEAVRAARVVIHKRDSDDPTWLAYTVYADPHATVRGT